MTYANDVPLFDLHAGVQAQLDGTRSALEADRVQEWRNTATAVLERLAAHGGAFTADDVIAAAGLPDVGTNRNNAVGGLFNAASRQGWIVKTGLYRKSTRAAAHARVLAVWVGARPADCANCGHPVTPGDEQPCEEGGLCTPGDPTLAALWADNDKRLEPQ